MLTLVILGRFTLMPELLDFLGNSQALLRFIDYFGGMTIEVPSREQVAQMARDVHIWRRLTGLKLVSVERTRVVEELAAAYGVAANRINEIFNEMQAEVDRIEQVEQG